MPQNSKNYFKLSWNYLKFLGFRAYSKKLPGSFGSDLTEKVIYNKGRIPVLLLDIQKSRVSRRVGVGGGRGCWNLIDSRNFLSNLFRSNRAGPLDRFSS